MSQPAKAFPYVDLFPDDPPPRLSPVDRGGQGLHFIYLSNRNAGTYLFTPREVDQQMLSVLHERFPMGYSTLFLLEKLSSSRLSTAVGRPPDEGFCVFVDPARAFRGGSAVVSLHPTHEAALEALEALDPGLPAITARVVDRMSWH